MCPRAPRVLRNLGPHVEPQARPWSTASFRAVRGAFAPTLRPRPSTPAVGGFRPQPGCPHWGWSFPPLLLEPAWPRAAPSLAAPLRTRAGRHPVLLCRWLSQALGPLGLRVSVLGATPQRAPSPSQHAPVSQLLPQSHPSESCSRPCHRPSLPLPSPTGTSPSEWPLRGNGLRVLWASILQNILPGKSCVPLPWSSVGEAPHPCDIAVGDSAGSSAELLGTLVPARHHVLSSPG